MKKGYYDKIYNDWHQPIENNEDFIKEVAKSLHFHIKDDEGGFENYLEWYGYDKFEDKDKLIDFSFNNENVLFYVKPNSNLKRGYDLVDVELDIGLFIIHIDFRSNKIEFTYGYESEYGTRNRMWKNENIKNKLYEIMIKKEEDKRLIRKWTHEIKKIDNELLFYKKGNKGEEYKTLQYRRKDFNDNKLGYLKKEVETINKEIKEILKGKK